MKTRIKITESQYKEIFLNENKNVISEQALSIVSKIIDRLPRTLITKPLSLSPQNITKIRKAFKIADNVTLNTIEDVLKTALQGGDKLTSTQIKTLFGIDSLVQPLIKVLENDPTITKLLKLRQTALNISVDHPSVKKIDDILTKYIPTEYIDDVVETSGVEGISKEYMKTAASKYTTAEMKKIFDQIKNHQDLITWMEKNNENLLSLTKSSNSVNLLSPQSRELWYKISKDVKKYLPLLEKTNDDLLKILSNDDIDANLFKKKLLSSTPGKTKQFFLDLYNTPFGSSYIGKKLIGGFLILSSITILGYSGKKLIDFVSFVNSKNEDELSSETSTSVEEKKPEPNIFEKSLEGFDKWFMTQKGKMELEDGKDFLEQYIKFKNDLNVTLDNNTISVEDPKGLIDGSNEETYYDFEYDGKSFKLKS